MIGLFRDEFARFAIKSRHLISHDTAIIRAALPMLPGASWGEDFVPIHKFPPSFCVMAATALHASAPFNFKPYTPLDWSSDHLDLLVKGYPSGAISRSLFSSQPGDLVLLQGPREKFLFSRLNGYKKIVALAGGTGIAPIYQVLKHLTSQVDHLGIIDFRLICANRTRNDILLSFELERMGQKFPALSINHIIEEERGFLKTEDIPQVTSDTFVMICGPKGFNEASLTVLTEKMYEPENKQMLPTDPEIKSGVPSEERSIIYGTALGLGTVIMGTKLLNLSPLQKPVHLALGGISGAIGGWLLFRAAKSMENRVLLGERYYKTLKEVK